MKTLTIPYPETLPDAVHMSDADFRREAVLAMAVKLFEMGKLTTGQAAELAEIPRVMFIQMLSRFGVPAVSWDVEECGQEFRNA
jgi:predicted HTH domain antitoxin